MFVQLTDYTYRSTPRYSKMGALVITRAVYDKGYVITHVGSGSRVCESFPTLVQARRALPFILLLADWSSDAQTYIGQSDLGQKVRQVREDALRWL
jgi:hypothetical protein